MVVLYHFSKVLEELALGRLCSGRAGSCKKSWLIVGKSWLIVEKANSLQAVESAQAQASQFEQKCSLAPVQPSRLEHRRVGSSISVVWHLDIRVNSSTGESTRMMGPGLILVSD